jgi:hypothetical protein
VLAWHELHLVVKQQFTGEISQDDENQEALFDWLLARLLIRVPADEYKNWSNLVPVLDNLHLYIAPSVLRFLLGYEENVEDLAQINKTNTDDLVNQIYNQKTKDSLSNYLIAHNNKIILTTKISGCKVNVICPVDSPYTEIGESLLAMLESIVSTRTNSFAWTSQITLDICIDTTQKNYFIIEKKEHKHPFLIIKCQELNINNISATQIDTIREELFFLSVQILPHIIHFKNIEEDIETLFIKEKVAERSIAFTGSFGSVGNILGQLPKFNMFDWLGNDYENAYEMKRSQPWEPAASPSIEDENIEQNLRMASSDMEAPEDLMDFDSLSHEDMEVVSLINLELWDNAEWEGVAYVHAIGHNAPPPIMALMFKDSTSAQRIFSGWIDDLGKSDEKRRLRITIIRGIDKDNPCNYRVVIGSNFLSETANKSVRTICRINTMTPQTSENLDKFLQEYQNHECFTLGFAQVKNNEPHPGNILSECMK